VLSAMTPYIFQRDLILIERALGVVAMYFSTRVPEHARSRTLSKIFYRRIPFSVLVIYCYRLFEYQIG